MTSTFTGLETGKRSLITHQTSLQTLSHNISNADVEGYSRQRVTRTSMHSLEDPSYTRAQRSGQIGQGVEISHIKRDRDIYLDKRISNEISNNKYWENKVKLLGEIETIYDSLGDVNLQKKLDSFWSSWQELSNNPKEPAIRNELLHRAEDLTNHLNHQFSNLNALRKELDVKVAINIQEINTLAKNIADLNKKIVQSQAVGDDPNDWLDKRDQFVERLSEITDISINHKDPNEHMVYIQGKILIQGDKYNELQLVGNPQNEGLQDIYLSNNELYKPQKGQLSAHLDTRDQILKDHIRRLDSLSSALIYGINEVHQQGFDNYSQQGENFFNINNLTANAFGNFDINANGIQNTSMIYKIAGNQDIDPNATIGENGNMTLGQINSEETITIPYNENERISSIIKKVNDSDANINMYINEQNKLVVQARSSMDDKSLAIKYLQDSGQFLVGLTGILNNTGVQGIFNSNDINAYNQINGGMQRAFQTPLQHPSSWISINSNLLKDSNKIAASGGHDFTGDGNNDQSIGELNTDTAKRISNLRFNPIAIDNTTSYNEFYVDMTNDIAVKKEQAQTETEKYTALTTDLKSMRQEISGVNIDEEMTNMLAFQRGYQAAARVINTVDNMIDTIINRMGIS